MVTVPRGGHFTHYIVTVSRGGHFTHYMVTVLRGGRFICAVLTSATELGDHVCVYQNSEDQVYAA